MKGIFYGCSSLNSLPDISKWNTKNVSDMKGIFYECPSLKSMPDISGWNTNNVSDISLNLICFSFSNLKYQGFHIKMNN